MSFSTLASRALPATVTSALCSPSLDLVAVSNCAASTSTLPPGPAKISLYRTAGNVDLVWDWSEGGEPVAKGPFKGKGKSTSDVSVQAVAWSPHGAYLAVALSSPTSSTIIILSIHTGLPVLPALQIPLETSTDVTQISQVSWHTLSISSSSITSSANKLISRLPSLTSLDPIVTPAAATAASGVFGSAKNAALLKEREKLAGRALNLSQSAPGFPALLGEENVTSKDRKGLDLLVVSDRLGRVHLYLGGSFRFATINFNDSTEIVTASVIPSTIPYTARLSFLSRTASVLTTSIIVLQLPPTLLLFLKEVTILRGLLQHSFQALQEARVLWDEARRIGTAWLGRLTDLSADHGVTLPVSAQMLGLLTTGRPNRALLDFLATKTNERGFTKWDGATTAALDKLKRVGFMNLVPAVERIILLLDETRSWAIWPEAFGAFQLDASAIEACVELSSEIILRATELERMALEEEECFYSFTRWIKYELEKVSHQDGSEIRPQAKFQPCTVARYIQDYLISSPITPVLAFGMGSDPIAGNLDVQSLETWFQTRCQPTPAVKPLELSLGAMMKRMKEELRGQADATLFNAPVASSPSKVPTLERPQRAESTSVTRADSRASMISQSLPVMLHVLAHQIAGITGTAAGQEQEQVVKEISLALGNGDGRVVQHLFENLDGQSMMYYAWESETILYIKRLNLSTGSLESSIINLKNSEAAKVELIDFDFFDDFELVLLLKTEKGTTSNYSLEIIEYAQLSYASIDMTPTTFASRRNHTLDNRFPPQSLSFSNREDRKIACILCAEGRKIAFLDMASSTDFEMI